MGSVKLTKWTPEDDLLLKNSVEAGASLESLAKGAVHFSHRFTFREVKERWYSLLYDCNTSAEASARIIEIENELSTCNPAKGNRLCNPKGKEFYSAKRKEDSLRSHYYTIRKRIRSEPPAYFPNSHIGTSSDCGFVDQLIVHNEQPIDNSAIEAPLSNGCGMLETECGGGQHVPQMMNIDSSAISSSTAQFAFHSGRADSTEDEFPNGRLGRDCLHEYKDAVSSASVDEEGCSNMDCSFQHKYVHEIRPLEALTESISYEHEDIGAQLLSHVDSANDNHKTVFSGSVQNYNICSQDPPVCSDSLQQPGCFSQLPDIAIWRINKDMLAPVMPLDGHFEMENQEADVRILHAWRCDSAISEPKLDGRIFNAGLDEPGIFVESDFMDFSSSDVDFADNLELFRVDADGEDISERSLPDGLCLCATSDMHQSNVACIIDPRGIEVRDTCYVIPDAMCSQNTEAFCDQIHSSHDNDQALVSDVNVPSTFVKISCTAEPFPEFMVCELNTEDMEIPCNDDVVLPSLPLLSSAAAILEQISRENTGLMSSSEKLSADGRIVVGDTTIVMESDISSPEQRSFVSQNVGLLHSADDCAVESVKLSESSLSAGVSRHTSMATDDRNLCTLTTVALCSTSYAAWKEETMTGTLERGLSDPVDLVSNAGQEEQFSDSENCVPYFSDIEALILGMDLDPYDQEALHFAKEVSRFQCLDTKRAIARLEQTAHCYMKRAILSCRALAVLYGRRLKHFIKTPEVLLGRATQDVKVDIDLRREGHANQISRRQAIIKMMEDGTFFLKNLGKSSIFVNSKEVLEKKCIRLLSDSLLQIKDMSFIFEVNESAVKHYSSMKLKLRRGSSKEQGATANQCIFD